MALVGAQLLLAVLLAVNVATIALAQGVVSSVVSSVGAFNPLGHELVSETRLLLKSKAGSHRE